MTTPKNKNDINTNTNAHTADIQHNKSSQAARGKTKAMDSACTLNLKWFPLWVIFGNPELLNCSSSSIKMSTQPACT